MKNFVTYVIAILVLAILMGLVFRAFELEQNWNTAHPYSRYGSEI